MVFSCACFAATARIAITRVKACELNLDLVLRKASIDYVPVDEGMECLGIAISLTLVVSLHLQRPLQGYCRRQHIFLTSTL